MRNFFGTNFGMNEYAEIESLRDDPIVKRLLSKDEQSGPPPVLLQFDEKVYIRQLQDVQPFDSNDIRKRLEEYVEARENGAPNVTIQGQDCYAPFQGQDCYDDFQGYPIGSAEDKLIYRDEEEKKIIAYNPLEMCVSLGLWDYCRRLLAVGETICSGVYFYEYHGSYFRKEFVSALGIALANTEVPDDILAEIYHNYQKPFYPETFFCGRFSKNISLDRIFHLYDVIVPEGDKEDFFAICMLNNYHTCGIREYDMANFYKKFAYDMGLLDREKENEGYVKLLLCSRLDLHLVDKKVGKKFMQAYLSYWSKLKVACKTKELKKVWAGCFLDELAMLQEQLPNVYKLVLYTLNRPEDSFQEMIDRGKEMVAQEMELLTDREYLLDRPIYMDFDRTIDLYSHHMNHLNDRVRLYMWTELKHRKAQLKYTIPTLKFVNTLIAGCDWNMDRHGQFSKQIKEVYDAIEFTEGDPMATKGGRKEYEKMVRVIVDVCHDEQDMDTLEEIVRARYLTKGGCDLAIKRAMFRGNYAMIPLLLAGSS